jgi:hypothetical protein
MAAKKSLLLPALLLMSIVFPGCDSSPEIVSPDVKKSESGAEEDGVLESSNRSSKDQVEVDEDNDDIESSDDSEEKSKENKDTKEDAKENKKDVVEGDLKVPVDEVKKSPESNIKVVDFAKGKKDSQVGNGISTDLEAMALSAASAKLGNKVAQAAIGGLQFSSGETTLYPGDIMRWEGNTNHNNLPANPSETPKPTFAGYMMLKAIPEGHVSIISEVVNANEVKVLHQNINNQKTVREDAIRLDAIVAGKIEIFRTAPK